MPANWDTGPDVAQILSIVALVAILAVGLFWSIRSERRKTDVIDAERTERNKKTASEGTTDDNGTPLCVVCGEIATHPTVRTGRPWFDDLPVIRTLNNLWARAPRYAIVKDRERGACLCSADNRNAIAKLERVHARWRAKHAEFNAEIGVEERMLEQGGLEQILRDERAMIRNRFMPRAKTDSAATLKEAEDDEIHLLPVSSATNPEESQY